MDVTLTDNSDQVKAQMQKAMQTALETIGTVAEGHAKTETPVDTGRLRNSISHAVQGDSAYIGTNVEYGPYVENGSIHNKPHHMLQKAATGHSDEYKEIVKSIMENS